MTTPHNSDPIPSAMNKLIADQERRHSWLLKAAEQVRRWKAQDVMRFTITEGV